MKKFIKTIFVIGLFLAINFNLAAYADVLDAIIDNETENSQIEETGENDSAETLNINNEDEIKDISETLFSDISGHWAESRIKEAIKIGFVSGYVDGTFKPDNTVTRAEFATLLNNAMKIDHTVKINLSDVNKSDWFYQQVQKSVAVGFFSGYENNTFRPNNPITRQEAAKVISSAITAGDIDGDGASLLKDYSSIQDWAKTSVNTAYNKSYIMGYPEKLYRPSKELTRAEAVKIIYEILDNENIEYGFNITNSGETYYGAVVVGDLNILDSVGSGNVYINNVTVLGNINILAKNVDSVVLTDVKAREIVESSKNPIKITCNDNIYIDSAILSADTSVEKIGTNILIKNTIIQ